MSSFLSYSAFENAFISKGSLHGTHVRPSALAYLVSRVFSSSLSDVNSAVMVMPDLESAQKMYEDIFAFQKISFKKDFPVFFLPTWEESPFQPAQLSVLTRNHRISTLNRMYTCELQKRSYILISTITALSQSTLSPRAMNAFSMTLEKGQSFENRRDLIEKFLTLGYQRVDPVEDPGTFCTRGELIDFYPLDFGGPVRIEFFDDQIEKIRPFSADTQRTHAEQELNSYFVGPAREVLLNSVTLPKLRELFKNHCDNSNIQRTLRDPILEELSQGIYVDGIDTYPPFSDSEPHPSFQHVGNNPSLIWFNAPESLKNHEENLTTFEKDFELYQKSSKRIFPSPSLLFGSTDSLQTYFKDAPQFFFDSLSISNDDSVQVMDLATNEDLLNRNEHDVAIVRKKILDLVAEGFATTVLSSTQSHLERSRFLLNPQGLYQQQLHFVEGQIEEGFRWKTERIAFINDHEILGGKKIRREGNYRSQPTKDWSGITALQEIGVDDLVVHYQHGIGQYRGLRRLTLSGASSDFIEIDYAEKNKLYLPVYKFNAIQRYSGSTSSVSLDRLGSQTFEKTKEKVRKAVRDIAFNLVQLYAQRSLETGTAFAKRDPSYFEFEARFPHDETPDQQRAIEDTLDDLESGRIMDRLVCGDVGFGKTEIAMRAAFQAVQNGMQVGVLVPTTLLCEQHELSFQNRMKDYPIQIASISRLKSRTEVDASLKALSEGKLDIVIGTHRLLSKDIEFKDLGLLIVDEEHRFGVEHKEKLKALRANTHVLTLTATPIPRTLHMALSGLRDISLITTPPINRLPIRTVLCTFDENLIRQVLDFEIERGGQAFVVHNRVEDIYKLAGEIQKLSPSYRVCVAHGQMKEADLEKAMLDFYHQKCNILICTTIIESGLDIPNANTILINHADKLGLSQLYQLRGRVGRSDRRAYAYLIVPEGKPLTNDAQSRLQVIQKFVELGSGFQIASHDLEIRGGGNLLGPEQSGHIAAVGLEMYTDLLEEAIQEQRSEKQKTPTQKTIEPEIKTPFACFLDENYIPDVHQRLTFYRRLSRAQSENDFTELEMELQDRYGPLPPEAQNLIWILKIKRLMVLYGVELLTVGKDRVSLVPGPDFKFSPTAVLGILKEKSKTYQLTPDSKLIINASFDQPSQILFAMEDLLKTLGPLPEG